MKLGAQDLRNTTPTKNQLEKIRKNEIFIVLDNVLDTYNIGAIFRLADAVSAKKVYLCGETETPPNSRIMKASVNTWQWVTWSYASTAVEALHEVKSQSFDSAQDKKSKVKIIAIEQSKKSIPYDQADYHLPIALVVGHETEGVSKEVLNICDEIVELPMLGVNKSLNVMVSLGIVLYEVVEKNRLTP